MVGSSSESSREHVKKVQLVLTSHSTHIAPEGREPHLSSQSEHTHTQKQLTNRHGHTHICIHLQTNACTQFTHICAHTYTEEHTNTGGGAQTGWAAFTSQCRASLTFSPLSYALVSSERGAQRPSILACIGRLTKQCKEYSEIYSYDTRTYNAERKSALLDCWV